MPAISLATAQAKLQLWLDADEALAVSASYEFEVSGTRRKLTRADAPEIQKRINYWMTMVNRLQARGTTAPGVRLAIPMDR
jgi:hypothetical protein